MLPSELWLKKVREKPWKPAKEGDLGQGSRWNTNQVRAVVVILAVLGIALLLWPSRPAPSSSATPQKQEAVPEIGSHLGNMSLEGELSRALAQIKGVGAVQTKLTLKSEGTRVYATNERVETRQTQEKDQNGISRNITEQSSDRQLVLTNNTPVLEESRGPEIVGVLVIAEGASNPAVEESLSQAVTGLLGLPASRVTILPMEKGGGGR